MSKNPPARITQSYLENVALHYLERYASSSANVRRVLLRRIHRSTAHWGDDQDAALTAMDAVLQKLTRLGYLDDSRYALAKAGALRSRGGSARKVRAGLAAKGVDADLIDQALAQSAERGDPDEIEAALIYARKRKLGPFRPASREDFRTKDLAAMGRAGFGWDVAKRIIDSKQDEERGTNG